MRSVLLLGIFVSCVLGGAACQSYREQLQRGQGYYEQNQYEQAEQVLRLLEPELDVLSEAEQVRYFYLRGMSHYRRGDMYEAYYWLSLAQGSVEEVQGALQRDEEQRLERSWLDATAATGGLAARQRASTVQEELPCRWSSECREGFVCKEGICRSFE